MGTMTDMLVKLDNDYHDQQVIVSFSSTSGPHLMYGAKECAIVGTAVHCVGYGPNFVEALRTAILAFDYCHEHGVVNNFHIFQEVEGMKH